MKFSILIPAYKVNFLVDAINSVLFQSYQDWELVILNDHSPYDIENIINHYKDDRIKYYENEKNVGAIDVVNNWNRCLSLSTGDYVICMGDDDVLHPDCLSLYAEYIDKYPKVHAFHSRSIIIDENGDKLYITDARPERESVYALMSHRMKEEQFIGDFCFRASILKTIGGYYYLPLAWGSDDMTAYLCSKNNGVVNVPTPIFYYRKSSVNISSTGKSILKIKSLNILHDCYLTLLQNNTLDDIELLEIKSVERRITKYFFRRKSEDISLDIQLSFINTFKWILKRKKYKVSLSCILYAVIIAFGKKYCLASKQV